MSIDKQLQNISTKQLLHDMVNELEDGDQLLIVKHAPEGPGWFYTYGQPTNERVLYLGLKFLLQWMLPVQAGGIDSEPDR